MAKNGTQCILEQWDVPLTTQLIREKCDTYTYRDGQALCDGDAVNSAVLFNGEIEMEISGYEKHYVTIDGSSGFNNCRCTCAKSNLFELMGYCEHVAAGLIYTLNNIYELRDAEMRRADTIHHSLSKLSADDIKHYLKLWLTSDSEIYADFVKRFKIDDTHTPRNYDSLMEMAFDQYKNNNVSQPMASFDYILKTARESRDNNRNDEALRAYKSMHESAQNNRDTVEDTNGYYTDFVMETAENLIDSILRQDLDSSEKQQHIRYFFEKYMEPSHQKLLDIYNDALANICDTDTDTQYLLSLAESHTLRNDIPADVSKRLMRMLAQLYQNLGDTKQAINILKGHYLSDPKTCIQYLNLIQNTDDSKRDAQKASDAFADDAQVLEAALAIFPPKDPTYTALLQKLFVATGEWTHFYKLRDVTDNWDKALHEMAQKLLSFDADMAVKMFIKAGRRDEALNVLISADNVSLFAKHIDKFAKKMPAQYVAAYGECLRKWTRMRSGVDHYKKTLEHLNRLEKIPNIESEFETTLHNIQKDNAGRRVLLNMINNR